MSNVSYSRGKARIGVFVPFTNVNLEADMALLRPPGVSFHFQRLGGYVLIRLDVKLVLRLP